MTVLLPEQPLHHPRPFKTVCRDQGRSFRQIEHDGIRLGQHPPIGKGHCRDLAKRVDIEKPVSAGITGHDIHVTPVMGQIKKTGDIEHLQAVA